jgi:putative salt-induced outer membrane protein YdiY
LLCGIARAQQPPPPEPPKRPWTDSAEFSLVNTTGNAEAKNFSLSNKYVYTWSKADFTFDALALRVETTTKDFAAGTETTATTAETYALGGKYRHNISEAFFWYGRAAWLRNRPAGIDSRTTGGVGVGYHFIASERQNLAGELGIDYADETQIGPPEVSDSFAQGRVFVGYDRKIGAASKFNAEIEFLENLDTTSDWRANLNLSLTTSLTQKLAMKAGYRVIYDNEPAVAFAGPPPVLYDKTDTIFSVSLVVNF